jgi:hypothetical protein
MKKISGMLCFATVLTLCASSVAVAGTKIMTAGPALMSYPNFTGNTLHCNILNLYPNPRPVTIEAIDYLGTVTDTSGPLVIAPSTGASLPVTNTQAARCRFTVDGSPKKYRAAAAYENGSRYTIVVPAQ